MKRIIGILLLYFLFTAQTVPQFPVSNLDLKYYLPEEYKAHKQNWAVIEDKRGILYFGNTIGVLEFDGHNWRLICLPKNAIVRSLAIDKKGKIYVGSRGEFGYLKPDSIGKMIYVSMTDKI